MTNHLDPDQDRHNVGPHDPICVQIVGKYYQQTTKVATSIA